MLKPMGGKEQDQCISEEFEAIGQRMTIPEFARHCQQSGLWNCGLTVVVRHRREQMLVHNNQRSFRNHGVG